MIAPDTTALVLLAAGMSRRFGSSDKLTALFLGQPLGLHVVTTLEGVPFARRIVVRDAVKLDYAARGYTVVHNERPEDGQSLSLRLGVAAAREPGIGAVLIALADMPLVTAVHVHRLFDAAHGPDTVVASSDGLSRKPPALFGAGRFDGLEAIEGDRGARDILRAGRHVVASADELIDVDTPEDLAALRAKFGGRQA